MIDDEDRTPMNVTRLEPVEEATANANGDRENPVLMTEDEFRISTCNMLLELIHRVGQLEHSSRVQGAATVVAGESVNRAQGYALDAKIAATQAMVATKEFMGICMRELEDIRKTIEDRLPKTEP